jgi:signal transduction histidine kinase
MDALPTDESSAGRFHRLFGPLLRAARKKALIRLHWPLVIICFYLLLYFPGGWLTPKQTHALLIFYLLTNSTLYFVATRSFDSPSFYGPLLFVDGALIAVTAILGGAPTRDFYLACCSTLILASLCSNPRGLVLVTLLAPALYAYFAAVSGAAEDPPLYLKILVPFLISIVYGYFLQFDRMTRLAREKEQQQAALAEQQAQLLENIQQQAEELRAANKVKDEFLSVVSHELRTPLNVILGYTNMLLERMLGEITPIQEKALQTVLRQTKELQGTINSVLQVSCMEVETGQPELQETNFFEFLYEIKSYYDYPLAKDVKLTWNFSSNLPTLLADRGKLRQILYNLINNAIKFTDRGSITVSAEYLQDKNYVELKVADSGIGIPKAKLPRIFDKFHQLDSSDSRAYGGVGLGLYIVKRCIDVLSGSIHVESKAGKGSIFIVRIPCYTSGGTENALPPLPERAAGGATSSA